MLPRKTLVANGLAVVVSLVVGFVLCEVLARLVLNPADYLAVTMRPDAVLGIAISPDSPGFDEWGFRNPAVPSTADVVTLGDSHTFGNTARMEDAWPSVLARLTGRSVYNLGLGGYGPNQYYQLFVTRGVSLRPKQVVCALYMGDDFENAYSMTYGLDYWASLREGQRETVTADIWGDDEPPGPLKVFRNWLSRHSMVYRLVVHGPVLGAIKGRLQQRMTDFDSDPAVTALESADGSIRESFRPLRVAAGLDQSRPEVKEGMRITFHFLSEMNRVCRDKGCSFSVVIIPTKETVFASYLQDAPSLRLGKEIQTIIANEALAKRKLIEFLDESGIPHLDMVPALRQYIGNSLYYPGPADMHPNKNGYFVIGEAVSRFIEKR